MNMAKKNGKDSLKKEGTGREREKKQRGQSEITKLNRDIADLQNENAGLRENLELLQNIHLEAAETAVDLLFELEYHRYKSKFVDIDIRFNPGDERALRSYGQLIKKFFLDELKCTYLYIQCRDINDPEKDLLKINATHKHVSNQEKDNSKNKLYHAELQDLDMPERIIGRILVGREGYRDPKKEKKYDKKINDELYITKRILENCISRTLHKALAVKDALTGLNTRKALEERLSEEFNSLDIFSRLTQPELEVLNTIIETSGQPGSIIRNSYFLRYKTKDDMLFHSTLLRLQKLNIVSCEQKNYLGEVQNYYYFESSKISYNLFVTMFDLDHFKDINDNWGGHAVGDRVLREFSAILKRNIRTTDIPIRYGGEEFIIIFPRASSAYKLKEMLEKIRKECEDTLIVEYRGKRRNVTVSIGMTQISKFDTNYTQIIARADAALYRAKNKRNRVIVYAQTEEGFENITDIITLL